MISIIIPIYKAKYSINNCVNSILSQTNPDWELILVDDGSPDGSGQICDEYAKMDSRIRVIHKPNGGVSSARNVGIENANGDWISFIDADDYVSNNYCEAVIGRSSDIILVDSLVVDLNGKIVTPNQRNGYEYEGGYEGIVRHFLTDRRSGVPWAKFFKREIIGDVRFEIGQKIGEDTVFVYEMLARAKSIEITTGYYYYWVQGTKGDIIKYRIIVDDAIKYACQVFKAYESINVKSIYVEKKLLLYFFGLIDKRHPVQVRKWFEDPKISQYHSRLEDKQMLPALYLMWKRCFIIPYSISIGRYLIADILHKYHGIINSISTHFNR